MLISELGIRGFKSYGNNEQVLKLNTEKGELILLVGNNGAGKSSLLDSFDYTLYGKVRGRKKKWAWLWLIFNECLWVIYAVTTEQYGFIFAALAYTAVYIKSFLHWKREEV